MRCLAAVSVIVLACGGPKTKKESSIVEDNTPATCCCKTLPQTAEKEITPVYAMANRMECSTQQGECVDDVQCNGQNAGDQGGATGPASGTGGPGQPPPPPDLPKGD